MMRDRSGEQSNKPRCPYCLERIDAHESECPYCRFDLLNFPEVAYSLRRGTTLRKRYKVLLAVKRGGMSIVYSALDLKRDKPVAIKEFFPEPGAKRAPDGLRIWAAPSDIEDFEQGVDDLLAEARLMERLSGLPGTIALKDFFLENGSAYIVMPLLLGDDLSAALRKREKPYTFKEAVKLLRPVLGAVHSIHTRGFLHGDISASNIFLENNGRVKLLDMGAMRKIGRACLATHIKSGYTPPEMYRADRPVQESADVYSMAATIYRLITWKKPQDARERTREDALTAPLQLGVKISADGNDALMRALSLIPEDRPPNMAEFAGEITEIAGL